MSALNSFSVARDLYGFPPEIIQVETSERILSEKGIFIIPYDIERLVAFVTCEVDVMSTVNESRTIWSNPEISFYGYCHIRRFKQSIGNPVQINQRNQVLFTWFPQDNFAQINSLKFFESFLVGLTVPFTEPYKIYLSSPYVTDFSFGFQREGKFRVKVSIGYFNRSIFPDPDVSDVIQDVPNPSTVESTDPSQFKDLNDNGEPISAPYNVANNDYGESIEGEPVTDPVPVAVPFEVVFIAEAPGYPLQERRTTSFNPGMVLSISTTPVLSGGNWVFQGLSTTGAFEITIENEFPTQAQNDAFQASFQFLRFEYP